MLKPPFALAPAAAGLRPPVLDTCCHGAASAAPREPVRTRLADLDPHLHCSVIGTCLPCAELRQRIGRQQTRLDEHDAQREAAAAARRDQAAEIAQLRGELERARRGTAAAPVHTLAASVALQTERRERAESAALATQAELQRVESELAHLREQASEAARELAAAELQLRALAGTDEAPPRLRRRRILYVGGRPSSGPAIRALVQRHGGELQRHDGGVEDRKGLLAAAVGWADTVVFPVDCIDHDSALALKRLCQRQGTPFMALRSASVTSFAVALLDGGAQPAGMRCHR